MMASRWSCEPPDQVFPTTNSTWPGRVLKFLQTRMPRFTMLEDPRPCTIFLFCVHTLCTNYLTKPFLLVSSSVRSKQLLCFVYGQGQKREQKHTIKNFVEFHKHSSISINFGLRKTRARKSNRSLSRCHHFWKPPFPTCLPSTLNRKAAVLESVFGNSVFVWTAGLIVSSNKAAFSNFFVKI